MDYKKTLNLPRTNFPMKANLLKHEPEQLKLLAEHHIGAVLVGEAFMREPSNIKSKLAALLSAGN